MVILGVAAAALYYDRVGRYSEATNDATIQADQVTITNKLAGYVRELKVAENQTVKQGELLVALDAVDYQTRASGADADLASALATAEAARASQREARAGIDAAQAAIDAARADLDFAVREEQRFRPLVATGAEPAFRLSELSAQRQRATAAIAAQRASLVQARRRVESIGAEIAVLAAKSVAARVQVQGAANDMSATRLTAPVAGRVANRSVRAGQFVQPGTRLMTIVPNDNMYVVANFKETQIQLMRPGQSATIRIDALPGVAFAGTVESIAPGTGANFSLIPPQNATGNFTKIVQRVPVRIRILDAGPAARRLLVPGLSLEVEVETRTGRPDLQRIHLEQGRQDP